MTHVYNVTEYMMINGLFLTREVHGGWEAPSPECGDGGGYFTWKADGNGIAGLPTVETETFSFPFFLLVSWS